MFRLKGLTFQLSFLILAFAGLISVLLYGYNFIHSGKILYKEVDKNATSIVEDNAHRIESTIALVQKIAYSTKNFIETSDFDLPELERYLMRAVESNPEIYGSSVCFEPFEADSTTRLYSLYFYRDGGAIKSSDLSAKEYYYPDQSWYNETVKTGNAIWSEPYYDQGGGNVLMSTFSVPFYRNTPNGKIIRGVITCDLSLVWLQEFISGIKVYNNGYGLILSKEGTFLAHPDTNLVMKKTVFQVSKEKNIPVLEILGKKMIAGERGDITSESVVLRKKSLVRFYPIQINGWSLAVVFPHDEIYADLYRLVIEVSILGLFGFFALFIVLVWVSRRIARPLNVVTSAAELIAAGNLKQAKEIYSDQLIKFQEVVNRKKSGKNAIRNEIIRLFVSIDQMTQNLYGLILQVQKSGIQVGSSANEISASSRELEANASEQVASTKEVSATSKSISRTSNLLAGSIHQTHQKTENTVKIAQNGRESLDSLDDALKILNKSTQSITGKLSVISGRANKISSVVTAINKISEQTNLLSFNAAIEAEKAGEYGKGFSVVAREISRLADQTAVATDDIEKMVREMQSSVSSGVMEMDKFSDEVRKGADHIYSVASKLNSVIDEVNDFAPDFRAFASGMDEQSDAALQISESMTQLERASEQSKDALSEFRKATLQLNDAVIGLQSEVNKFIL